ncbi:hypothetical protein QF004_002703 [Chryseobacterium sp. MDT2-18]|nr:hypothetical protein [Chryseobacterium sp. MDT2-18]
MENRIIYLNNGSAQKIGFNRQRNVNREHSDNTNRTISEAKKHYLRTYKESFSVQRTERETNRSLNLPYTIDFIKIHFYKSFDNDLHRLFLNKYGITPVEYTDFNRTVLFQIEEEEKFEIFLQHLQTIIDSAVETTYQNAQYNLLVLIERFSFYTSQDRVNTSEATGLVFSLISTHLIDVYNSQKEILFAKLNQLSIPYTYLESTPGIIEIHQIEQEQLTLIINNFDIVKTIISSRAGNIRPGIAGPVREYGFTITVADNLPVIGIIDTGITRIDPFREALLTANYNHTNHPAEWDEEGHGTLVAGLVILGDEFYLEEKDTYPAKAKIINIKALHFSNDELNIPKLISDIRDARRNYGVKLFNMSLVIPGAKKYNSTFSRFAYELDKLAYEEDLLLFISVGNFSEESLKSLKEDFPHGDHEYPNFFYCLNTDSDSHLCEDTNICCPSESLNNISVGAIAHNLEEGDHSDVTPSPLYPAHYTRKFHFDFNQTINGSKINTNSQNKNLNKPDFLMEGGDLFNYNSGMQILRSTTVDAEKFYGRTCGTSLATPLLTSYAAEILKHYPNIRTQSVKAMLMNSAGYYKKTDLPAYNDSEDLLKSLIGFGRPDKKKLLSTDNNSIAYLIEGEITLEQIIRYPIYIPAYMRSNGNKLQFDVSLSYSFNPVMDHHLSYLPLHIAFCLVKNLAIEEIADTNKSFHGIKNSFAWSEDHFGIDNKVFSNAQKTFCLFFTCPLIFCAHSSPKPFYTPPKALPRLRFAHKAGHSFGHYFSAHHTKSDH